MKTLTEILTEQTQDLKAEYLLNVKIWAEKSYQKMVDFKNEYHTLGADGYIAKYGKNNYYSAQKKVYNVIGSIVANGFDLYKEKEVKKANQHYNDSIAKLVFRLNEKGIFEAIDVVGARVDVNFEITIKHAKGITRAWTIVASGAVQKPHYRYLVK